MAYRCGAFFSLCLAAAACGPVPVVEPLPWVDAGTPSAPDAAVEDAGVADAGAEPSPDAGLPNAQSPDQSCADPADSVYVTPPGPQPTDDSARGDRVKCAYERTLSLADVTKKVAAATSAVASYKLSYRTKRGNGDWAIGSARVWLPQSPKAYPLPIIVIAHPSVGVADSCAPSKEADGTFSLALPWAGKGYAVIAPDFAGLGTDGIQAYVDSRDTGQSTLDAARALRKLHTPATFDARIAMLGYSQGGGAVFAAQALERSYGSGGKLTAAIAFAPQWQSRLDSFGTLALLRNPNGFTIWTGVTKPVIAAMRQYGYFATYLGAARAGDGFPAAGRAAMINALDTMCLIGFGGWVQGTSTRLKDLVDEGLRSSTIACLDTPNEPACKEPGKGYLQYLRDNLVAPDPQGAPVLYVQGMLDTVMPAGEEAACNVPRLQQAGVDLQVCTDAGANHANVIDRNGDFALRWAEAKLSGTQAPTCAASPLAPCPP